MAVLIRYLALAFLSVASVRLADVSFSSWTYWASYYFAVVQLLMALLFYLRRGEGIIGKSHASGLLPLWSYVLWWPFHLVNALAVHSVNEFRRRKHRIEYCTEIMPGWFLGGWFSDKVVTLPGIGTVKEAGSGLGTSPRTGTEIAVCDLTVEFPERIRAEHYCLVPVWDGTAPSIVQFQMATEFIAKHAEAERVVVIHCAFGVGRSTTMMIAAMLREGRCRTIEEGLMVIKKHRPCCKLNAGMRAALQRWVKHLDSRKACQQ